MGFSKEWDERYRENTHMSIWPWTSLISVAMRFARPEKGMRVLELGCGAGANIPFFLAREVDYHAIEGSASIVERLKAKYPQCREKIACGDFTQPFPFDAKFDLIIDRGSVTHNNEESIRRCLRLCRDSLVPGGKFVGIDWFAAEHWLATKGDPAEDKFTRTNYTSGPMANLGRAHFSDEAHMRDLFTGFKLEFLEHKLERNILPYEGWLNASWEIVAAKA
jgi:SAM-dependent methyltransferase